MGPEAIVGVGVIECGVVSKGALFWVLSLTPRDETEWPETVKAGWNTLVGCNPERIPQAALAARPTANPSLSPTPSSLFPLYPSAPGSSPRPYGDGQRSGSPGFR